MAGGAAGVAAGGAAGVAVGVAALGFSGHSDLMRDSENAEADAGDEVTDPFFRMNHNRMIARITQLTMMIHLMALPPLGAPECSSLVLSLLFPIIQRGIALPCVSLLYRYRNIIF